MPLHEQGAGRDRPGVVELVGQMAEGLSTLVTQHLALMKMEIVDEVRELGTGTAKVAAFIPFLFVGYVLWSLALAAVLAGPLGLGWAWGLFISGSANMVVGVVGVGLAVRRLQARRPVLNASLAEMKNTAAALAHPSETAHVQGVEVYRAP